MHNQQSSEHQPSAEFERTGVLDSGLPEGTSPDKFRQARRDELRKLSEQEGPGVVSPDTARELGRSSVGQPQQAPAESQDTGYHRAG